MKTDANAKRGEVIRAKSSRDSSRVAPLQIGGRDEFGRQRIASPLELAGDAVAQEPSLRLVIDDWQKFQGALRLTLVQQIVFNGHWKKGIERHRLPRTLGLTPRQVSSALDAIDAALRKIKNGHAASSFSMEPATRSLALSYREQLQTGRRIFTLSKLDDVFLDVIRQERFSLFSQRDTNQIGPRRIVKTPIAGRFMTIEKLRSNLADAKAKLDRLIERQRKAASMLTDAEIDFDELESAAAKAQVQAELDESVWNQAEHQRKLATARAKISAAESAIVACRGAVAAQQAMVEGIESEIEGQRLELLQRALSPSMRKDLFTKMQAFCDATIAIRSLAHAHGFYDGQALTQELFPRGDDALSIFPAADMIGRGAQCNLINAAAGVSDYLHKRYDQATFEAAS